ncbi:unnamed protein product [Peniophora sp. CBMAI 1063]|nr:unnamed protein product [Peniophora sp. CBMAI 1063]
MASPSDESLVSTKSKRSRFSKIFRRNSSSTSVATVPASPDAHESSNTKAEPSPSKADSGSIKSKRTPMDRLLRRSSTSSLASVGVTDTQVQASPEPQPKSLKRTDSASSSLSAVVSDAKAEDTASTKSKGKGALRRSLSALSITRPRHRRAASDPLAVDTRSASPPPVAPSEGLHKMLSPVEESPVVVRGSILALEVPPAEPAGAPEVLSASGVLVDRPTEADPEPAQNESIGESVAAASGDASAQAPPTLLESTPQADDARVAATVPEVQAPQEVEPEPPVQEPAAGITRSPSPTGSAWTEAAASSAALDESASAVDSTLAVVSAPVGAHSDVPAEPVAESAPPVVDIVRTPSPAASVWTEADANTVPAGVTDGPSVAEELRATDSQSTILEPDVSSSPPSQPVDVDAARPASPSPSASWTEADMSSSGVEESQPVAAHLDEPQIAVAEAQVTPLELSQLPISPDPAVEVASPTSPVRHETKAPTDVIEHPASPAADARSVDTWSDVSSVSSIHFAAPTGAAGNAAGPSSAGPTHLDHHDAPAPPEPEYAHLGWVVHLPGVDGSTYFTHRGYDVVTDIDLRSNETLYQVSEVLSGLGVPPPTGWEMWLGGDSRAPACSFVNHNLRLVASEPVPATSSIAERARYWAYVEQHPAHCALAILSEQNINQAKGALSWDRMNWPLTPTGERVEPPLFTADERRRFAASINSLEGRPSSYDLIIATRDIAEIMRRLCHWELSIPKPEASTSSRARNESARSDRRPRMYPRRGPRAMPGSGPGGSGPLWIVAAGVAVGVGFALIGGGMSRRTR